MENAVLYRVVSVTLPAFRTNGVDMPRDDIDIDSPDQKVRLLRRGL